MNKSFDLQDGFFLDHWFVEPQLGRLSKNERSMHLEPKIMEVLVLLAQNQPKVIRKEVFLNSVWRDVNVIDHVLARAISAIRLVFNDDPRKPRVIETLPKIGYKLLMPISASAPERPLNINPPVPMPAARPNVRNLGFFLGGIATVVLLAIGLMFLIGGGSHTH